VRRPLLLEILGQTAAVGEKSPIFSRYSSASAVAHSKKFNIDTNMESTTRFPMSLRWTSHVAP